MFSVRPKSRRDDLMVIGFWLGECTPNVTALVERLERMFSCVMGVLRCAQDDGVEGGFAWLGASDFTL